VFDIIEHYIYFNQPGFSLHMPFTPSGKTSQTLGKGGKTLKETLHFKFKIVIQTMDLGHLKLKV